VAAIWNFAPIDNANKPDGGGAKRYHGSLAARHERIEEHFGDAVHLGLRSISSPRGACEWNQGDRGFCGQPYQRQ